MKVNILQSKPEEIDLPLVILGYTEQDVDKTEYRLIKKVIELGDFSGKKYETSLLYTDGSVKAKRILLVGLGKKKELDLETVRKIIGATSRKLKDIELDHIGISLPHFTSDEIQVEEATEGIVQSIIMGSYKNPYYKTKNLDKYKQINELTLFGSKIEIENLKEKAINGQIIGEAVNYCRKLAWGPGNLVTPTVLAEGAEKMGRTYGIKVKVLGREESKKIGLHSFLAVAQGTMEPPKFIITEYGSKERYVDTVAIIGKGITFDTGGISIKSREGLPLMKADMTGGAVVLATMEAIARLELDLYVIGIVPATDNMPDGKAYHPGDIINTYSGQTVEVISTDAEGRMILNDALSYAAKNYKPKAMIDVATLTGSMHVTIGDHALGYFSNSDWVSKKIEKASIKSGERVWRMPLWDVYDEQLESDVADFKHTGGRPAGAITAARFLSKFVMKTPWAHFDIAGHPEQKTSKDYNPKGSKGPAVRLLIQLLRNWNN